MIHPMTWRRGVIDWRSRHSWVGGEESADRIRGAVETAKAEKATGKLRRTSADLNHSSLRSGGTEETAASDVDDQLMVPEEIRAQYGPPDVREKESMGDLEAREGQGDGLPAKRRDGGTVGSVEEV